MELMNHFKVSLVIHGQTEVDPDVDERDPYEVPKGLGKFQQIDSGNPMSTQDIITRIIDNRFVEYFEKKKFSIRFCLVYSTKNETRKKKQRKLQPTKPLKNCKLKTFKKQHQFMFQIKTINRAFSFFLLMSYLNSILIYNKNLTWYIYQRLSSFSRSFVCLCKNG